MAPRLSRLASTISRDDIIAVIGANSPSWPASGSGALAVFDFWLIGKAVPTKVVAAKDAVGFFEIVDIVIDLKLTWPGMSNDRGSTDRGGRKRP